LLRRSGYAKAKKGVKFLPITNACYKTKYTPLQGGRGAAYTGTEWIKQNGQGGLIGLEMRLFRGTVGLIIIEVKILL